MEPVAVLVAAAGATWEPDALRVLESARPGVVLLKRCVDLADLLATAATGLAGAAVVSGSLPGLDADAVASLRRAGLGVLLVDDGAAARGASGRGSAAADGPAGPADEEVDRLLRLGAGDVARLGEIGDLARRVRALATVPVADRHAVEETPLVSPGRARVTAVWGPAGAPGRTTVAVGLAAEAAVRGESVLLVDADPYAGAVGQHLGVLDEVSGLLAAARAANAGSLDAGRLACYAREVVPGLAVLTGLPRADRWPEVRPAAFARLLEVAGGLAGHVVLDTGFSVEHGPPDPFEQSAPSRNGLTVDSLERADEVVVVGAADPVGLARLARALVELHELLPGVRPRVVVNRTRATLGWGEREVRGMVEGFVTPLGVHFLPDDRAAADRALMAGRSLPECGDSSLRSALAAVADGVLGGAAGPRRRSAGPGAPGLRRRRGGRGR